MEIHNWYGDRVNNIICRELQCLLPNPIVLVAVSRGMQAVKLCTNEILQFLNGGRRLTCIMAVKRWLLLLWSSSELSGCAFRCVVRSNGVRGTGNSWSAAVGDSQGAWSDDDNEAGEGHVVGGAGGRRIAVAHGHRGGQSATSADSPWRCNDCHIVTDQRSAAGIAGRSDRRCACVIDIGVQCAGRCAADSAGYSPAGTGAGCSSEHLRDHVCGCRLSPTSTCCHCRCQHTAYSVSVLIQPCHSRRDRT